LATLQILYIDNHLIAVNKPFGMLTQADHTRADALLDLTREWIKNEFNKPGNAFLGLLHRLDQPVAGVVLFARTSKGASRLSEQFRERSTRKIYLAAVEKIVREPQGTLAGYISKGKNLKATVYPRPTPGAKEAELHYRVLESRTDSSILEVEPLTGRFHQIRAQLSFMGHPIIGDVKYGAAHPLPERQIALFAQKLIFAHPITKEEVIIEAPLPPGWPFLD
jgi:23S rRNA pseudouridine1911/1915/1917 synthase